MRTVYSLIVALLLTGLSTGLGIKVGTANHYEPIAAPQCVCGDCGCGDCDCGLSVPARLQMATVTIRDGHGHCGSGVIYRAKDHSLWVWTVAHVVESARKQANRFDDVHIILPDRSEVSASVVRSNKTEDIALLRLGVDEAPVHSIVFATRTPAVGTELYHVGSPLGPRQQGTVTTGIVSFVGRNLFDSVWDQASTPAYAGSSGGAICLKSNGRLVGLVSWDASGMASQNCVVLMTMYVPVRRIRAYASRTGVMFAVCPAQDVPDHETLYMGGIEQ